MSALTRLCAVALLAGFAAGAPSSASAQETTDPRPEGKIHLGPFYMAPSFELKEFGIDTNVFNNADEKKDFTVTLGPKVDVAVPFARRARVTTALSTDIVYYAIHETERSFDPGIRTRGELFLNRITLFAEPTYLRTRQRVDFDLDARARRQERGLGFGVDLRATRTLAVELGGRVSGVRFDADEVFDGTELQETLNRQTRTMSARARLDLTPLTAVVLRAEGGVDAFEFSPVRDARSLRVMPGVEFRPGALISGTAFVGFRSFTPRSAQLAAFRGLVASAALDYTMNDTARFQFTAERDLSYSYDPDEPYFLRHGYGLSVERRLIGATDVTLGVQRHRQSYRALLAPGALAFADSRVDIVRTLSASFGYRYTRGARVGFGVDYRARSSNLENHRDYSGLRFSATANYGF